MSKLSNKTIESAVKLLICICGNENIMVALKQEWNTILLQITCRLNNYCYL